MIDDELQLVGHRILVHGHGDTAQGLGRAHGSIETWTVVTDDGDLVTALESQLREPAGQILHILGKIVPGPRLPDAELLFARGVRVAITNGIVQKQLGKRVQGGITHTATGRCINHRLALLAPGLQLSNCLNLLGIRCRRQMHILTAYRPRTPSLRLHADGAIQANDLAVEHRVFDDMGNQRGILLGAPETRGKGHLRG